MRLAVTPSLSTKDGAANKNARLTNTLREKDKAVIRPGLELRSDYAGLGNGLIPLNGDLLALFGNNIWKDDKMADLSTVGATPVPLDYPAWSSGTTYDFGDWVSSGGNRYMSTQPSNLNNTPSPSSAYWTRNGFSGTWDSLATPALNDSVVVDGVTYYAQVGGQSNNQPAVANKKIAHGTAYTDGTSYTNNLGAHAWGTTPVTLHYSMIGLPGPYGSREAVTAALCASQPDYTGIGQDYVYSDIGEGVYNYTNLSYPAGALLGSFGPIDVNSSIIVS